MAYYPIDKNPSGLLFVGDPGANSLLASVTNVVYDSGQGFLGVNVAQPEFALDVSGTGSFEGVRFSDGSLQTTAASSASDLLTVSGIAQSATDDLATASGHLQTQITSNDADILTVSGLIGIPGGDDKSIQFNNAGSFSGEPKFTWDYDVDRLTVSGSSLFSATGTVLEVTNTNGTSLFSVKDSDEAQVIVAAHAGQTGMPFEVKDSFGANVAYVDIAGNISGNHVLFGDGTLQTTAAGSASDLLLVSGIAQEATDDLATASGHLQTQITSNDSDISALQTATGVLRTDVDSNDVDINIVSGIAQGAADDVVTASGHLQNQISFRTVQTNPAPVGELTFDVNMLSGSLETYTLPTVTSNAGKIVRVKKTDQVVNRPVTISGNAVGQMIDELNLYTLYNQHEAVTLICDGSNWQVF